MEQALITVLLKARKDPDSAQSHFHRLRSCNKITAHRLMKIDGITKM